MVNTIYREDKATQAASRFLKKIRNRKMSKLRLIKYLYLADKEMLLKYGDLITHDAWFSMDKGPVLSETYNRIKPDDPRGDDYWLKYIQTVHNTVALITDPGDGKLSVAEEEVIDDVFEKYGRMTITQLIAYMHELPEWEDPHGKSKRIPFEKVLELNNFSAEDIECITDDINEQDNLARLLETAR